MKYTKIKDISGIVIETEDYYRKVLAGECRTAIREILTDLLGEHNPTDEQLGHMTVELEQELNLNLSRHDISISIAMDDFKVSVHNIEDRLFFMVINF